MALDLFRMVLLREANCAIPLIQPPDNSLHADLDASSTRRCSDPAIPDDSRYYLDDNGHSLNLYGLSINGVRHFGFCLDHSKNMPSGNYANITIQQAMPDFSEQQRCAVAFAIANTPEYPVSNADFPDADAQAADFFTMLGVDPAGLNGWDAYAVTQATVWAILRQVEIPETATLNPGNNVAGFNPMCSEVAPTPTFNPKSPRLVVAAGAFLTMATAFAAGDTSVCGGVGSAGCGGGTVANPGGMPGGYGPGGRGGAGGTSPNCCCGGRSCSCNGSECCCCKDTPCFDLGDQLGKVMACITDTAPAAGTATYILFTSCPNDIREHCGRVLLGPFKLDSTNEGTPDITFLPCKGCDPLDIDVVDYCGRPKVPGINEAFYITFRPPCTRYCFDLEASMLLISRAVYFYKRPNTTALQPLGVPQREEEEKSTRIHICIDITPPLPPPEPEPWWEHILVNNNNNNNNNDSSNNDNNDNNSNLLNNLLESLLSNLLSSNMMSNIQGGNLLHNGLPGAGPGPPVPWAPFPPGVGPFPPVPFPPGSGPGSFPPWPFPPGPGPGPFPPGPHRPPYGHDHHDDRFPFPWGLFPPGTTPCPPPDCGGPNPCCCPPPPPCCPPPCPPPCWCPPPCPSCPPPCSPWPCPCPEPCFIPYPYIPEPNFIIQPASLTYQALPMPVPCFCPQPVPYPQSFVRPFPPFPQPYPPYPYSPYPQGESCGDAQQTVQQVYNPVTVVVPPADPSQQPVMFMPDVDPWLQYSAPWPSAPPVPPAQTAPQPFYPPPAEPMPLLLPEFSSAPRPDFSPFESAQEQPDLYDQFYRDWYGQ